MPLSVLAVILSEAKDPESVSEPQPVKPLAPCQAPKQQNPLQTATIAWRSSLLEPVKIEREIKEESEPHTAPLMPKRQKQGVTLFL